MITVNIHEAKAKLSSLVANVQEKKDHVVISKYGKPVAEIIPFTPKKRSLPDPRLVPLKILGSLTESTVEEWEDA